MRDHLCAFSCLRQKFWFEAQNSIMKTCLIHFWSLYRHKNLSTKVLPYFFMRQPLPLSPKHVFQAPQPHPFLFTPLLLPSFNTHSNSIFPPSFILSSILITFPSLNVFFFCFLTLSLFFKNIGNNSNPLLHSLQFYILITFHCFNCDY